MKSVFITGGTTGIGLELARYYQALGWRVGICGRDSQKYKENFLEARDSVVFYPVDVSSREDLLKAIEDFSKPIGLHLLIANAGIGYKKKTVIPDFDYSYKMVEINLLGVMYSFEAALKIMLKQRSGHLVAISSLAGFNGMPGVTAYSATKSAVMKYCESLSIDLKPYGIFTTAIAPGFIRTPLTTTNHHPMPFLMNTDKAIKEIVYAINKKKVLYSFPFLLATMARLLSFLPRSWYVRFMSIKVVNWSKKS